MLPPPPTCRTESPQEAPLRFLMDRIDYERSLSMPVAEEAFKLDRMRALLHRLGDPQNRLPIIHVAGTKGKRSTAAMIGGRAFGGRLSNGPVHFAPSRPRRGAYRRRRGGLAPPEEFADLVELVRPAVEALDRAAAQSDPPEHGPTYFEIITAAALCHLLTGGSMWPSWKWGSAAGSIRPTSARRPSR